ncbi:MAG TPA: hypothetical protein PKK23_20580 [Nitrospirales bacterium]|nr:hypothetical protein [Nitrospirales bacterium]
MTSLGALSSVRESLAKYKEAHSGIDVAETGYHLCRLRPKLLAGASTFIRIYGMVLLYHLIFHAEYRLAIFDATVA